MACTGARSCIQRRINLIRGIVRYHTVMRRATVTITRDHLVILAAMKQYIATEMAALVAQPLVPATSNDPPTSRMTTRASSVTSGVSSDVFVDAPSSPLGHQHSRHDSSSADESDGDSETPASSSRSSTNADSGSAEGDENDNRVPSMRRDPTTWEEVDRSWVARDIDLAVSNADRALEGGKNVSVALANLLIYENRYGRSDQTRLARQVQDRIQRLQTIQDRVRLDALQEAIKVAVRKSQLARQTRNTSADDLQAYAVQLQGYQSDSAYRDIEESVRRGVSRELEMLSQSPITPGGPPPLPPKKAGTQ